MRKVLSARFVETVKPGGERKDYPDPALPGLYLVLQPSGAKRLGGPLSRSAGRTRKHTLRRLSRHRSQDRSPVLAQSGVARRG